MLRKLKRVYGSAWKRLGRKGDVMGIPIQYLLIFLALLIVLIIIIVGASRSQGGLLKDLFGRMGGMG
ncbi:TPA: hypothetical protein HA265_02560 [Candidatus Woesearchaeota archaeon]|nr:hypothetical protein [Candidatus Woesearchaeota archaeon]